MKYIVLEDFHDRLLNRDIQEGSPYPPEGMEVSEDWINKLMTEENKCARSFIEPIAEGETEPPDSTKLTAAKKPRKGGVSG